MKFPKSIDHIIVPPIKIQGIKTKLVPFIAENISWDGNGTYFEPFLGSGVVAFNLIPEKAVLSDINPFIIQFYTELQSGKITSQIVREFLFREGEKLAQTPKDNGSYYYTVRNRFNESHSPLDFLFLQRSNFNGMIRFNSKGEYNVPFGRNPNRFAPALITKITNQVRQIELIFQLHPKWRFICESYENIIPMVGKQDFIYLDPPYIGRHDTYYTSWSEDQARLLANLTQRSGAGWALSMWLENKYRFNEHVSLWSKGIIRSVDHYYFVGGKEFNRNAMTEALIIEPKHLVAQEYSNCIDCSFKDKAEQLSIFKF